MNTIKLFIFMLISVTVAACRDSDPNVGKGVFKRVYERDGETYELIELQENKHFRQQFFQHGKLRFDNRGQWEYVPSNRGHSEKWRVGQALVIFTDWLSAEELLRRESLGDPADVSLIQKEESAAIVRDANRFAFDEDGGSDYKVQ